MIRALQAAQDWINDVCHEAVIEWRKSDSQAEALWAGHLSELNPTFKDDMFKRQMLSVAWEIAAVVALLLMFAGLAFLRG